MTSPVEGQEEKKKTKARQSTSGQAVYAMLLQAAQDREFCCKSYVVRLG